MPPEAEVTVKMQSGLAANVKEVAPPNKNHAAKPSHRRRGRENRHILTTLLGILVIAVALLLGTVVGWRFGWQRATLQIRNGTAMHRSNAQSKVGRPDEILPSVDTPCRSAVSGVSENTGDGGSDPGKFGR